MFQSTNCRLCIVYALMFSCGFWYFLKPLQKKLLWEFLIPSDLQDEEDDNNGMNLYTDFKNNRSKGEEVDCNKYIMCQYSAVNSTSFIKRI